MIDDIAATYEWLDDAEFPVDGTVAFVLNKWVHMCAIIAEYGVKDWWFYWLNLSTLQTWYFAKRSLSLFFSVYFRKLSGTPIIKCPFARWQIAVEFEVIWKEAFLT